MTAISGLLLLGAVALLRVARPERLVAMGDPPVDDPVPPSP